MQLLQSSRQANCILCVKSIESILKNLSVNTRQISSSPLQGEGVLQMEWCWCPMPLVEWSRTTGEPQESCHLCPPDWLFVWTGYGWFDGGSGKIRPRTGLLLLWPQTQPENGRAPAAVGHPLLGKTAESLWWQMDNKLFICKWGPFIKSVRDYKMNLFIPDLQLSWNWYSLAVLALKIRSISRVSCGSREPKPSLGWTSINCGLRQITHLNKLMLLELKIFMKSNPDFETIHHCFFSFFACHPFPQQTLF